jgi:hypothetical protein
MLIIDDRATAELDEAIAWCESQRRVHEGIWIAAVAHDRRKSGYLLRRRSKRP